jgi:hypothetical protein
LIDINLSVLHVTGADMILLGFGLSLVWLTTGQPKQQPRHNRQKSRKA